MEFIYHFYIIEAILAIILFRLSFLLIITNKHCNIPQNDSKLLSKYKSLQSKHNALHVMLDKIIVEKINIKSTLNDLDKENIALRDDNEQLLNRYNQAIKALDTNTYISDLKSQDKINKGLNK